jgi:hypothetical protein
MLKIIYSLVFLVVFQLSSFAQHSNEFFNDGALVHIEAGAEVHVWGDVHIEGASAVLENNGLLKTQGNSYSDNLFQQSGIGTYRIENSDVNTGERQFVSGSYAVRGGTAQIGVNDGSFFALELANDQGIVYLNGSGNICDVRGSVNFSAGVIQNRIITHDVGITGALAYPGNGAAYDAIFGLMNSATGLGNLSNNTVSLNGNMSATDAGYVQGKMRRSISPAGGSYPFVLGLEPAGFGVQRGMQYMRINFTANSYDVVTGYFQTGLDNSFAAALECSGYLIDYWGGTDHGQWIMNDITGAGSGTYEVQVWPQDDNFPAKSVWMVTKDNAIDGTADDCGPSPVGLDRNGFDGFSQFGLAAADVNVLPIELLNITAQGIEDHIDVIWNVASELDLSHYELERSEDGIAFEYIESLDAVGTTTILQTYSYSDFDVRFFQDYYYRVKSVDIDGEFDYTPVVAASLSTQGLEFGEGSINIYPNPTINDAFVSIYSDLEREIQMTAYNTIGQRIQQRELDLENGNTVIQLQSNNWADGMYYIEFKDVNTNQIITKRLIKQ